MDTRVIVDSSDCQARLFIILTFESKGHVLKLLGMGLGEME